MRASNYDKTPCLDVPGGAGAGVNGWDAVARRLGEAVARRGSRRTVVVVECYPGVRESDVLRELTLRLRPALSLPVEQAFLEPARVEALVAPFLGGEDPVFGFLSGLTLPEFFDSDVLARLRGEIGGIRDGVVLVVGCGARLVAEGDLLIYADLARWEIQQRFRRGEIGNLGARNPGDSPGLKYKRAFFVDWRVADRWKRPLMARWDFVLDTHHRDEPRLVDGDAVRRGLRHAVTRPFRVVPYFDPAPWGGQWMREVCDLDRGPANFGWCFDCVPEENSLLLRFGEVLLELPSINVVFFAPHALLGEAVHARFGDEFPIRFDLLDTVGGGNLSFQVHPLTEYIQHHFGMHYTQDESYYLLDVKPGASVYLGLRDGVDRQAMVRALELARDGGEPFAADRYAHRWPAAKHDHFLIPAGTVHCSGANSVVLEISATPYIFTFKLWDWGRLGLDGRPRPIHLQHGIPNIQWERTSDWVSRNLINRIDAVQQGKGWREERTGLHEREFIETRRHWFTDVVPHDTRGGVHVVNLVEGHEGIVESPDGAFAPFPVHYAETFIVPAAVGPYAIRPMNAARDREFATLRACVRTGMP